MRRRRRLARTRDATERPLRDVRRPLRASSSLLLRSHDVREREESSRRRLRDLRRDVPKDPFSMRFSVMVLDKLREEVLTAGFDCFASRFALAFDFLFGFGISPIERTCAKTWRRSLASFARLRSIVSVSSAT